MSDSEGKKRRSGLADKGSVVSRLVGQAEQRQRESATDGRGRPGHAGELGRDKLKRSKATYNLSVDRQNLVREMAEAEDISQADVVELAVVALYNAWQAGVIDLQDMKTPARSLRVASKLVVPDDFAPFSSA